MVCDISLHIFSQHVRLAGSANEEMCGTFILHMKEMVHKQLRSEKVKGRDYLENVGEDGRILKDKAITYSFLDCYRINKNTSILSRIFNIFYSTIFPGNFHTFPFAGNTVEQ
jgi:hypothetical protein